MSNREVIQENNLKLQNCVDLANNLPEYQDIEPIYGVSDWRAVDIPLLNSGSYSVEFARACYPYILMKLCENASRSYEVYIMKIEEDTVTAFKIASASGYSDYYASYLIGYDDTYVYFCLGGIGNLPIKKLNTLTGEISDNSTTLYTRGEFVPYCNLGNNLVLRPCVYERKYYPATLCKISENGEKVTTIRTFSNGVLETIRVLSNTLFYDTNSNQKKLYRIIENEDEISITESSKLSVTALYGVNASETKVFADDGIYVLSSALTIGEKIAEYTLREYVDYQQQGDYYIGRSTHNLYKFNEDSNIFETIVTLENTVKFEDGIFMYLANDYVINFIKLNTNESFKYNDKSYYFKNNYSNTTSDKVLIGYEVLNQAGQQVIGTMPNNGELNYNSSTEEQIIPAGYTSGGTIAPALLTDTEYDECLELSQQILGESVSL